MARHPDHNHQGGSAGPAADPASVLAEIARLEGLDLGALRVAFRNHTGRIAPARIAKSLLFRVLAYRIQADAHGDLRPETRRLLDRNTVYGQRGSAETFTPSVPVRDVPKRGTVLVREWQGRMEHVMVLDQGFAWNGTTFPSLSAVALAITGTKWNGRRFFGLDRKESGPQPHDEPRMRDAGHQRGLGRTREVERNGPVVAPRTAGGDAAPPPSIGAASARPERPLVAGALL